jgi:hypothetical protein
MPSVEETLLDKLAETSYALWRDSWRLVIDEVLAREVLSRVNAFDPGSDWALPPVNDLSWRVSVIQSAQDLANLCEMQLMKSFHILNSAVMARHDKQGRPYDKRTRPGMLKHIRRVLPTLLAQPASDSEIVSRSTVAIWQAVANLLGRRAYAEAEGGQSDTALHYLLLLAGYFHACKLPNQDLVAAQLSDLRSSLISIQGTLVDIVERVSSTGVEDARPRVATHTGRIKLGNQGLSPLLDSVVTEANLAVQGNGFLLRSFGSLETDASPKVEPTLLASLRRVAYGQYEYTTLGFMALSAVEQLLRTFGFAVGLLEGNEQFNNETLEKLALRLGGSSKIRQALDSVYGKEYGNLRNRILHGAQLHIRRHQIQAMLPIAAPSIHAPVDDELSPQNTCRLCLECLEIVDEAITKIVALEPVDLEWCKHFQLSQFQIQIGMKMHCDFQGEDGKLWWDRISGYLAAVSPNVRLLFDFGFIGWVDRKRTDRFVLFMALNLVLEALFRIAVRLQGGEVLMKRIINTPPSNVFRYKMLDERELCAPDVLDRLVDSVNPEERPNAKYVLLSAVRIRNAVAHGALQDFDTDAGLAMGHMLVKAIQCLVDAGEHEIIKVAAYFRRENRLSVDDMAAWLDGEREVMEMIAHRRQTL